MSNFQNRFKNNFTQIPNDVINDKELSLKAKGLLIYLISKKEGWNFSANSIASQNLEGKTSINNGLKELENLGYLKRIKYKSDNGKFDGIMYVIKDRFDDSDNQLTVDGKTVDGKTVDGKTVDGKTVNISNTILSNTILSNNKISNNNSIGQNKNFATPTQENQIDLYDVINEVENENNSLKTEKEKRKKVAPKKEKEIFIEELVLEGVLQENATILANERVKNKKSVSSIVYKNIIKECKENNIDINHAVEVMVIKGWQGFKAQWYFNFLNENNNGQQTNNTNGSNTDSNSGSNKIDRESLFKRLAENHEMRNKFM